MSLLSSTARRSLAAGAAVLVLGGSAVGIASAQSTPTPTASPSPSPSQSASPSPSPSATGTAQPQRGPQAFIDALAKRLNITPSALQQAIDGARADVGAPAGGGFGPGGPGGQRRPGGAGGFGGNLDAAAQAIGISADQLRQELPGKSLTDVAQAHGKNPTDVDNALKTAANTRIDQAVADGRLTADQATARKQQVDTRIDQQMTQVVPQPGQPGQAGQGAPTGPGGPGRGGPGGRGAFGQSLSAAADAIGIPVAQLQQELAGKSLTDVAQAHGKNPTDVDNALKTAADARIDQAVSDGRLTADQATTQKQQIGTRIDQLMTQVVPQAPAAQ